MWKQHLFNKRIIDSKYNNGAYNNKRTKFKVIIAS